MTARVTVLGSFNMDLVCRAADFPRPGETQLGASFSMHPGGKGANQAVAACRLGAEVAVIGAVGQDEWGKDLRALCAAEGVDIEHVARLKRSTTGVGMITVVEGGENAILVASGANMDVTVEMVEAAGNVIAEADILLLQNEVPAAASLRAARFARDAATKVLVNAAPAVDLPPELLPLADILVVNRAEARCLAGLGSEEDVSASGLARRLAALGPPLVAVTLGAEGAVLFDGEAVMKEAAPPVDAIDTVGAGDAFVAALAVTHAEGARMADALRVACAAGALTTTAAGAIPALPKLEAVQGLIGRK